MSAGIDPDEMRRLGSVARVIADDAADWYRITQQLVTDVQLEAEVDMTLPFCQEITQEMTILGDLCYAKASEIEYADIPADVELSRVLTEQLESSLRDFLGADFTDPKFADLLAELRANPDFTPEWYAAKLAEAYASGDPDMVRLLAAALWQRLESMDPAGAEQFLSEWLAADPTMQGHLVVLIAAGGIPKVPAIVDFAVNINRLDLGLSGSQSRVLAQLGVDVYSPAAFDEIVNQGLIDLSERGRDGIEMILNAAGKGKRSHSPSPIPATIRRLAQENGDIVILLCEADPQWAVQFATFASTDASDTELKAMLDGALAAAIRAYGDDPTQANKFLRGLAQLDRAMQNANRPVGFNNEAVIDILVKVNPYAAAAWSAFKLLRALTADLEPEDRSNETAMKIRNKVFALTIIATTNPEASITIVQKAEQLGLTADGSLDADDWRRLNAECADDEALRRAMNHVDKVADELNEVYGYS